MQKSRKEIMFKREQYTKPYNLSALRKMSKNDETFVKQTLNIFIENSEDAIKVFNQSLIEGNWIKIGEMAHKILPSCRHLEIDAIVGNLVEIKTKTIIHEEHEKHEEVAQLVKETVQEMGNVISDMREELK